MDIQSNNYRFIDGIRDGRPSTPDDLAAIEARARRLAELREVLAPRPWKALRYQSGVLMIDSSDGLVARVLKCGDRQQAHLDFVLAARDYEPEADVLRLVEEVRRLQGQSVLMAADVSTLEHTIAIMERAMRAAQSSSGGPPC